MRFDLSACNKKFGQFIQGMAACAIGLNLFQACEA